jgi:PAS domain S-box-containing protein
MRLQIEAATLEQLLDVHEQQAHNYLNTIRRQQDEIVERSQEISEINEKLKETTNFLDEIHRTMPCALIVVDRNGLIETANHGALALLEYDETELIGTPISKVLGSEDSVDFAKIEALRAKDAVLRTEKACLTKSGKSIPVLFSAGMISSGETPVQKNYFVVCIMLDIRDRKRLEIELRQAQKLESIGQLAAGIAHELNTPTQYVGNNAQFLKDALGDINILFDKFLQLLQAAKNGCLPPEMLAEMEVFVRDADLHYLSEQIPKAIDQSLEGVNRVATIVRAMIEFSQPCSELKQNVDLAHAIENVLTISRNEWKYVAKVVADFDPHLPLVPCLPGDLNQVILNLIVNAAQAITEKIGTKTEPEGTITVSTRQNGEWAEILVEDTGAGIPDEIRHRIFDPFFTTKEPGKGSGQGLSIAHNIITKKHGGTIEFQSQIGQGTTFIIRLPIQEKLEDKTTSADAQTERYLRGQLELAR